MAPLDDVPTAADYFAGKFSEYVYQPACHKGEPLFRDVVRKGLPASLEAGLDKWKVHGERSHNKWGLVYCTFKNEEAKHAVVAFKGTETLVDWLNDYHVWLKSELPAITAAFNELQHHENLFRKELPNYTWSFTGHSLGAIYAEFAACFYNTTAITFDSPGSSDQLRQNYVCSHLFGDTRKQKPFNASCGTSICWSGIKTYLSQPDNVVNVLHAQSGRWGSMLTIRSQMRDNRRVILYFMYIAALVISMTMGFRREPKLTVVAMLLLTVCEFFAEREFRVLFADNQTITTTTTTTTTTTIGWNGVSFVLVFSSCLVALGFFLDGIKRCTESASPCLRSWKLVFMIFFAVLVGAALMSAKRSSSSPPWAIELILLGLWFWNVLALFHIVFFRRTRVAPPSLAESRRSRPAQPEGQPATPTNQLRTEEKNWPPPKKSKATQTENKPAENKLQRSTKTNSKTDQQRRLRANNRPKTKQRTANAGKDSCVHFRSSPLWSSSSSTAILPLCTQSKFCGRYGGASAGKIGESSIGPEILLCRTILLLRSYCAGQCVVVSPCAGIGVAGAKGGMASPFASFWLLPMRFLGLGIFAALTSQVVDDYLPTGPADLMKLVVIGCWYLVYPTLDTKRFFEINQFQFLFCFRFWFVVTAYTFWVKGHCRSEDCSLCSLFFLVLSVVYFLNVVLFFIIAVGLDSYWDVVPDIQAVLWFFSWLYWPELIASFCRKCSK